ncbi:hypothetical protein B0H13DRAFT_2012012, partial [Mycena leptocephala]
MLFSSLGALWFCGVLLTRLPDTACYPDPTPLHSTTIRFLRRGATPFFDQNGISTESHLNFNPREGFWFFHRLL